MSERREERATAAALAQMKRQAREWGSHIEHDGEGDVHLDGPPDARAIVAVVLAAADEKDPST